MAATGTIDLCKIYGLQSFANVSNCKPSTYLPLLRHQLQTPAVCQTSEQINGNSPLSPSTNTFNFCNHMAKHWISLNELRHMEYSSNRLLLSMPASKSFWCIWMPGNDSNVELAKLQKRHPNHQPTVDPTATSSSSPPHTPYTHFVREKQLCLACRLAFVIYRYISYI